MAGLFISQALVDAWDIEGKTVVTDGVLPIPGTAVGLRLEPAVRFAKSVGRPGDPMGVLNTVRRHSELTELGWEHYLGSVLIGEDAYEVDEGFVGIVTGTNGGPTAIDEETLRGAIARLAA